MARVRREREDFNQPPQHTLEVARAVVLSRMAFERSIEKTEVAVARTRDDGFQTEFHIRSNVCDQGHDFEEKIKRLVL